MNELYYARSENGLIIPYNFYKQFNYYKLVTGLQCELDSDIIKTTYPNLPRPELFSNISNNEAARIRAMWLNSIDLIVYCESIIGFAKNKNIIIPHCPPNNYINQRIKQLTGRKRYKK